MIFLLVMLAVTLVFVFGHAADPKSDLSPPWDRIREYAVSEGEQSNDCYVKTFTLPDKSVTYGTVYCQDGSVAMQRKTVKSFVSIGRLVLPDKSIGYAIYDHVLNRVFAIGAKEAEEMVYKCFREMVSENVI
jgi:hypothetical protein